MAEDLIPLGTTPEQPFVGSRKQALAAFAKYYINPRRSCPQGCCPSTRYVSNTNCITCAGKWWIENTDKVSEQRRGFYQENRERLTATNHARYAANPDLWKALAKKYAAENPERKAATDMEWRRNHIDYLKDYYNEWRIAHPEKMAAKAHKRRAAKLGSTEHFTAEDVDIIRLKQKNRCPYCGKTLGKKFDVDHVIPLSKGGSNGPENIAIAHSRCNRQKGGKDPIDFAQKILGRLL